MQEMKYRQDNNVNVKITHKLTGLDEYVTIVQFYVQYRATYLMFTKFFTRLKERRDRMLN